MNKRQSNQQQFDKPPTVTELLLSLDKEDRSSCKKFIANKVNTLLKKDLARHLKNTSAAFSMFKKAERKFCLT